MVLFGWSGFLLGSRNLSIIETIHEKKIWREALDEMDGRWKLDYGEGPKDSTPDLLIPIPIVYIFHS